MTPKKTVTLAEDVRQKLEARVEAEGGSLDDAANDLLREGLTNWQRRVSARDYVREIAEAQSEDEAMAIVNDAVHELRNEQHGR